MDFLDPKRKKSHHRRLFTGYLLVAVALAMATWLILNSSFGYWVDPKTGTIIQNGTVFVDTTPGGANITLDGKAQSSKTASRLVLPGSKQYTLSLSLEGYRDWTRTFALEGGKIERLTYPLLIPKQLATTEPQLYASAPGISSQSTDKRWLLVQQPGQSYVFDMYDLNNPATAPVPLTIPTAILTGGAKEASMQVVEWAGDNRHVLLERTNADVHEFIMLDTSTVSASININTVLTINPTSISLRDHKADQLYAYDETGGIVRIGDLKNRTISGAILSNVLAYKSYGSDIIMYAIPDKDDAAKVQVRIRENDKSSYLLKNIANASKYLLQVDEYDGTPYFVVGSEQDGVAFVYTNPLQTLKGQSQTPLLVSAVLRQEGVHFVSFSTGGQFIAAQSGNKLIVYDVEGDRQYKLVIPHTVTATTQLKWMDTSRLVFTDKEVSYIIDFDGSNAQALMPSVESGGPYFSNDKKNAYSVAPSKTASGRYALTQTSLLKK